MTRPILIDLHPHKYDKGLCYYPFMVISDRCNRILIPLMIHLVEYVFQIKQRI